MNDEQNPNPPFNPAIRGDFKLTGQSGDPGHEKSAAGGTTANFSADEPKKSRKSSRAGKPPGNRRKRNYLISWRQMKERLSARLEGVDRNKLKAVLIACGIATAVVSAVFLALKFLPTLAVLLGAFGLIMLLKIWDRLRKGPEPGY